MSRGLGKLQRQVLDLLDAAGERGEIVLELAEKAFDVEWPTPEQYESVRRAVQSLMARGLVCRAAPGYRNRRKVHWSNGTTRWHHLYCTREHARSHLRRVLADEPKLLSKWLEAI